MYRTTSVMIVKISNRFLILPLEVFTWSNHYVYIHNLKYKRIITINNTVTHLNN